ncbi:zinc ribbon domain-containing protein [Brevibacillus migulae]|uniref:zinc ribbon domain-containing protein n=1 Tax=Brevibacillus migulae TaxID=1644114 RepID=UPI00106EB4FD|nr:zinc ribbon domain-containing protein [Brevibacillus migulae]
MEQHQACQSCGMPLTSPEQWGTNQDGSKHAEYCVYCYEQGAFTQPDFTLEQMVDFCVPFLVEEGMQAEQARAMLQASLPHLKRWKAVEAN